MLARLLVVGVTPFVVAACGGTEPRTESVDGATLVERAVRAIDDSAAAATAAYSARETSIQAWREVADGAGLSGTSEERAVARAALAEAAAAADSAFVAAAAAVDAVGAAGLGTAVETAVEDAMQAANEARALSQEQLSAWDAAERVDAAGKQAFDEAVARMRAPENAGRPEYMAGMLDAQKRRSADVRQALLMFGRLGLDVAGATERLEERATAAAGYVSAQLADAED